MAYENTDNPLNRIFDLFARRQELEAAAEKQQRELQAFDQFPKYGVDEFGKVFLRGAPSASTPSSSLSISPLLLLGLGAAAIALLYYARRG